MDNRNHLVAAARGDVPLDILITNVQLVNVLTGTLDLVDIGISGSKIACVVPAGSLAYEARQTLSGDGLFAAPGFVDGHVHNESSMVTPAQWAREILPHGTTSVCTDPHEIGNVLGLDGIRYMLEASQGITLRYFVTASSCIPAVPAVETAGATFTGQEMETLLSWERVVAVAEAMDYPGLINQTGNITPIVEVGHRFGVPIEGHAPGVVGRDLQAYLAAAGPDSSDHESLFWEEMVQKVKGGMMVYARASTFRDGTPDIARAMQEVKDHRLFGFCTDDILPHHVVERGHLDYGLKQLIAQGVEPVTAIQMATINVARHYGLPGIGAIAPGWEADLLLLDDLDKVSVRHVIVAGDLVVADRSLVVDISEPVPPLLENTVRIPELTAEDFVIQLGEHTGPVTVNAIDMSDIFTKGIQIEIPCEGGRPRYPLPENVTVAAIVPRHGQNTPPSLAFIWGYPLAEGALASTISHDSHNLAILGKNPEDMLAAAAEMRAMGGGLVAIKDRQAIARVALPVAGLMSPEPVEQVAKEVVHFEQALPQLGLPAAFPIHLVAMALPVIPQVRITDKGVVDVATQMFIPLQL